MPRGEGLLPKAPEGWKVELAAEAPAIVFPTALVAAADGSLYLGQDPMDMPGPPTKPIDSIVRIKDGKVKVFADRLWAVMGLEWIDTRFTLSTRPIFLDFATSTATAKPTNESISSPALGLNRRGSTASTITSHRGFG